MSHKNIDQMSFGETFIKRKANVNKTLLEIDKKINFDQIGKVLNKIYDNKQGRPSYPPLMLLKCLLLHIIGFGAIAPMLSDYGLEEALDDRLSFRQFIGLGIDEYAPDHSTICRFRGQLITYKLEEKLFAELDKQMEELGLLIKKGTLIDATIVSASVSRPPKDKDGKAGTSEVDPEAEWTCKGNRRDYYGYKAHISVDSKSGIIRRARLTKAKVDDGHMLEEMVIGDEEWAFADKAYGTRSNSEVLKDKGIKNGLMKKGCYRRKLTAQERLKNQLISKRRSAVERVFGTLKRSYAYTKVRYIGLIKNSLHHNWVWGAAPMV